MSGKISPIAVAKEALSLSWARKWTFLGLVLLGMIPSLLSAGVGVAFDEPSGFGGVLGLVVIVPTVLVGLFVLTVFFHLGVTLQRGDGRLIPENCKVAMWRVFVRGLLLWLVTTGLMLIFMGPIIFLTVSSGAEGGQMESGMAAVGFIAAFAVLVGFAVSFGVMPRLAVMLPGAAVGHVVSLSEAMALTKGHTFRMIGSYLMIIVPFVALAVLIAGGLGLSSETGLAGVVVAGFFFLFFVFSIFAEIILPMVNCVWYEKLRLRYDSMNREQSSMGPSNSERSFNT